MTDFASLARETAVLAFPILAAVTFHEAAHGYVADRLGDPTPRQAGRLTFNPLAHLDAAGTLVFLITRMVGWAKPVPVNPAHFRSPRTGMLWVGLAGPAANLALAPAFAGAYHLLGLLQAPGTRLGDTVWLPLWQMARAGVFVNLGLGLFNLLPVPPLDGSRILAGLLPAGAAGALARVERFGFLLLLLVVFSGVLDWSLYPALRAAARALLGGP